MIRSFLVLICLQPDLSQVYSNSMALPGQTCSTLLPKHTSTTHPPLLILFGSTAVSTETTAICTNPLSSLAMTDLSTQRNHPLWAGTFKRILRYWLILSGIQRRRLPSSNDSYSRPGRTLLTHGTQLRDSTLIFAL